MLRSLTLKPDFADTIRRFAAWWVGAPLERPPVTLHVKPTRPGRTLPARTYATQRERWLDVEYRVDSAFADMERHDYLGESFPIFFPNLGPEICGTLFGCELEFSEFSSWSVPVVHEPGDWQRVLAMQPDFGNPYWRTLERMMDYAIERSAERCIVGITDLHGNYDLLASLRDPEALCLDLIDCPEVVRRAGRHAALATNVAFARQWERVQAAGMGATSWMPTYHEGPAYVPSCDFWCMVSGEMARDFVLPEVLREMAPLERSIFHLDGPGALRLLDMLLALPNLHAVQWVFGDGNGPASRWLDVYRRIQAAGKGMQVHAADAQEALAILEALGPRGLWLCPGRPLDSVEEARAFLKEVERVSRKKR